MLGKINIVLLFDRPEMVTLRVDLFLQRSLVRSKQRREIKKARGGTNTVHITHQKRHQHRAHNIKNHHHHRQAEKCKLRHPTTRNAGNRLSTRTIAHSMLPATNDGLALAVWQLRASRTQPLFANRDLARVRKPGALKMKPLVA